MISSLVNCQSAEYLADSHEFPSQLPADRLSAS